ncbi:hypothetical protein pEaSNUABM14_00068 [Erwinia phage pEa_SNUABM_14]|uniref:Uncharacterized protein n=1 Tax=Erwinia phage pEa_SNUABM_7 TaxID=2866695 RepID=A0AAE8BLC1_9CAUD|nr:hypothetical protein MPK74_gp069 [Erwinia phage pEa_SNUABM_7]QYW03029.1 hypothetical protein pEaSNUABM13_00070 [Erwinia phage pEa_SNUABM_13]QYW03370.1 hypothetical protein pEaSNUABM34_00068 [Erwinia phage pEa_SNUABM_34]QYW03711.1 hypothetical protein pEaSNUABM45_00068 [Erwinia phage pEa_SNUABM_45]QYW04052.1 hypothetical protein pEaSNUABM46_00068 [Erwinia phage pEa_SNUABM_46]QYW04393.1 hypothetical protein pEaSNUABM14_00068 [Erwinia phage pEa_SNUABM_14]QYW05083.1 hypothetical protein pEaSNU
MTAAERSKKLRNRMAPLGKRVDIYMDEETLKAIDREVAQRPALVGITPAVARSQLLREILTGREFLADLTAFEYHRGQTRDA